MPESVAAEGTVAEPAPAVPPDLSMVVLSVRDMAALRRFYRALGWQEQTGGSDLLSMFRLGGVTLALHPDGNPTAGPAGVALTAHAGMTLVVRVATAGGVDAACSAALRVGARLVSEPGDQPWGGRSALVADPEGNRWELLWVATPAHSEGAAPPAAG